MRDVNELCSILTKTLEAGGVSSVAAADMLPVDEQVETIRGKTLPNSAYSKAARVQLMRLPMGAELCVQPEEMA